MSTAVVLGPGDEFCEALAAALGARRDTASAYDGAVVCWFFAPDAHAAVNAHVLDFEHAMLRGFAATHQALSTPAHTCRRIVFAVRCDGRGPLGPAFLAAVAAFGKSLAREIARTGTTVNSIGVTSDARAAWQQVADATVYLMGDGAGFVTGQAFGRAGERLAHPLPAGPGSWNGPRSLLISGGSGAIGQAIARRLHDDGWNVSIGYTRREPAQQLAHTLDASGRTSAIEPLDLMEPDAISAGVERRKSSEEALNGLVLCGGWNRTAPFLDTAADEWSKTLAINLTGPARLIFGLVPLLAEDGGVVVGIGSESSRIGDAGRAVYAAAKAGLAVLLSTINGDGNVRAATVAPGPIDTPLLRGTHRDTVTAERQMERLRRLVPLARLGDPEEVAEAVSFLMSGQGRSLAGEVVSVGGGITMQ